MMYRIPHYVREVKRRLGTFLTQDWVSRLIVVIGAIGMLVIGVLAVEAFLRLFVLVIALVAIGLGGRFWWLHRAMPPAAPRKDSVNK
jgi:disulfide bond formation protein DsbB